MTLSLPYWRTTTALYYSITSAPCSGTYSIVGSAVTSTWRWLAGAARWLVGGPTLGACGLLWPRHLKCLFIILFYLHFLRFFVKKLPFNLSKQQKSWFGNYNKCRNSESLPGSDQQITSWERGRLAQLPDAVAVRAGRCCWNNNKTKVSVIYESLKKKNTLVLSINRPDARLCYKSVQAIKRPRFKSETMLNYLLYLIQN